MKKQGNNFAYCAHIFSFEAEMPLDSGEDGGDVFWRTVAHHACQP